MIDAVFWGMIALIFLMTLVYLWVMYQEYLFHRLYLTRIRGSIQNIHRRILRAHQPFKIGDLITSKPGNPGGYKHLNDGCVCEVLDAFPNGRLRLKLISHKDAHQQPFVGKEYKAPARNFILLPANGGATP